MGERIGLSDEEWLLIGPLLLAERGRGCRPASDNRPLFRSMLWIAKKVAQWRHLPAEYGKWNSVFHRYHRWMTADVSEAMLEPLTGAVEHNGRADIIDSTVAQAHHCALGIRKRLAWPLGYAKG